MRTHPTRSLLLALALLTPPAVCSQEDTLVRWYDLRPLLVQGAQEGDDVDLRLHLSSSFLDALEPDRYGISAEDGVRVDVDDAARAVAELLAEQLPDLDAYAEELNGRLRVEGPAPAHALAQQVLEDLRLGLLRPVDLELVGLDASRVPADTRAVLTASEAAALLETAEPTSLHRREVLLNRRTVVGREGMHAILLDYDVEVAQKASTADPQVTVVRDGVNLGVCVRETLSGRLLLRVWGRSGQLSDEFDATVLPDFGGAPLETVREHTRLMVAAAEVEDGGALLLRTGDGSRDVWVLRARRTGPERERANPLIPLADACLVPLLVEPPRLPQASPSGGWMPTGEDFLSILGTDVEERSLAVEDVLDPLYELRDELGEGAGPFLVGDQVLLAGSEALRTEGRARVAELVRAFAPHTVELELRYGLLDAATARTLGDGEAGWTEADLARLPGHLQGACRTGDGLMLVSGEERYYLQDHDVEIAEAATIADPIVGLVFEGVSLWARPLELTPGRYQVFGQLRVHAEGGREHETPVALYRFLEDPTRTEEKRPAGGFSAEGRLTLPSTARGGGPVLLDLQEGRWSTVMREGLGGNDQVLVAAVRLRKGR